jgi:modulator of FtsH protease
MSENSSAFGLARPGTRASTATIFGQVMFLVGIAIGFLAIGSILGRDLAYGTARILSFVAIGMLLAQSFVAPLRYGPIGMGWLFALSLVLGVSLGPVLSFYASADPTAVTQAAGGTALTTLAMGAAGLATSKDLVRWMRPLSYAMLGLFAISLLLLVFGSGGSPIFSVAVIAISAAVLAVDFNYVKLHATEDDVVWLATGIFVSIVNIFLALLQLFGRR